MSLNLLFAGLYLACIERAIVIEIGRFVLIDDAAVFAALRDL